MKLIILSLLLLSAAMAFVPASFGGGRASHQSIIRTQRFVFGEDWFDAEELKQRISQESSPQLPFAAPSVAKTRRPDQVHVILFNPHSHDEGMHTIEYPKGSGTNVILAFEDSKDCNVFSEHLKAQQFQDPTPQEMKLKTLEAYCQALGVFVQVVPKGTKLIPPSQNVQHFGHDPSLLSQKKTLGYLFEMSDREVEYDQGAIVEEEFPSWE